MPGGFTPSKKSPQFQTRCCSQESGMLYTMYNVIKYAYLPTYSRLWTVTVAGVF